MVMVSYSMGQREVLPGMRWRDMMTGSTWEVVEPAGTRIYSPSGFGGTPNFWCRCVEWTPEAERWKEQAREDGCIVFCGDSIASMLLTPNNDAVGRRSRPTTSNQLGIDPRKRPA